MCAVGIVAASVAPTGCADRIGPAEPTSTVVVGAPAEPDPAVGAVLAEIYAGVLARSGTDVRTDPDAGVRSALLAGLDSARLTLVPEQSTALLHHLDPAAAPDEEDAVYVALNRALPEGLSVADPGTVDLDDGGLLVPLFRTGALTDAQIRRLNLVAGELTTADLERMANEVASGAATPIEAAGEWLDLHGM